MKLAGKVALVTGAGHGIGSAVAKRLAREGADVAAVDIDFEAVGATAAEVEGLDRRALPLRCDVTKGAEVAHMVEAVIAELGRVDVLVNNVGGGRLPQPLEEITEEQFDSVLSLNLRSTFLCTRAVIPQMKRQGWGRIVNLSSTAGRFRSVGAGPDYAAAKAGVIALTRHLAADLAPFGININAVAPSATLSDTLTRQWASRPEEENRQALARIPMGRLATVEEVAGVVFFLCTDDAAYITGAVIDVNGGQFVG